MSSSFFCDESAIPYIVMTSYVAFVNMPELSPNGLNDTLAPQSSGNNDRNAIIFLRIMKEQHIVL